MIDVLIVGSGPVGAAYARTIYDADPAATILIVEAGPEITSPPGGHVKNVVDDDERARAIRKGQGPVARRDETVSIDERANADYFGAAEKYFTRPGLFLVEGSRRQAGDDGLPAASAMSCVGGMATQWTAACPRPSGSEVISFLNPVDLSAAFDSAESYLDVSPAAIATASGDVVTRTLSTLYNKGRSAHRTVRDMPLALSIDNEGRRRWSGSNTILGSATGSDRLEIRANTRCLKVLADVRTASGALLLDEITGASYECDARFVVIAGGSLHTPQLLFASGIRPAALGRYLNDHHMIVGAVRVPRRSVSSIDGERTSIDAVTGVTWIPADDETLPLHGQVMHTDASPVGDDGSAEDGEQVIALGFFAAKEIRELDRVEFSDVDLDARGMPFMTLHYGLTERDRLLIELAQDNIRSMTEALGEPAYAEVSYVMPRGYSLHYQGTVRMGAENDGKSVCDPHSRVWETDNVFVGGNGVIPTPTACNPTLTSVALAVLGAQEIVRELQEQR